ncbi:FHA domain-containing protein [Nakamurella antarctica]|uniref:FHA domain-containing protein n=1 Tax=Nakamurella antarctica TaxID=1902245 RepID=A0A3G8ZSM2_9ACTN|nr:FtsK/SpoIIIE domain-containing protein [Nakamurella antarctica]AZI57494.1 FHA domain-containing protein [Nakamurella antarctica]
MHSFNLPITLESLTGIQSLVITCPVGTTWGSVSERVCLLGGVASGVSWFVGGRMAQPDWALGAAPLLTGVRLTAQPVTHRGDAVGVIGVCCVSGPDAGGEVPLEPGKLVLGRDSAADLSVNDPQMSWRHASVALSTDTIEIRDTGSTNGVIVNDAAIADTAIITEKSLIRLGGSLFRVRLMRQRAAILTADGRGRWEVTKPGRVSTTWRSPVLTVPGPAPTRARRALPLLAAGMGAALGVGIAVITGYWTFLLLAALGPLMMLSTAVADRVNGRKSHRRETADHTLLLANHIGALNAAMESDREDAWDRFPDPAEVLTRAAGPSARLWERGPSDDEWLFLRVGVGTRKTRCAMPEPPDVADVPITLDLARAGTVGVSGESQDLLRSILAQLAVLHSPAQLRIVIITRDPDFYALRDLPHSRAPGAGFGSVVSSLDAAAATIAALRCEQPVGRTTVVILDNAHRLRAIPGLAALLESAGRARSATPAPREESRVLFICLEDDARKLPSHCRTLVHVSNGRVVVSDSEGTVEAEADGVSQRRLLDLVANLTPLSAGEAAGGSLPQQIGLSILIPEVFHKVAGPQALRNRWSRPSVRCVIGRGRDADLALDLDADGPHFLVAGTTGSGKSELLQTLVASLASAAPPQVTSFLLVDYKGGSAFAHAALLPHTTGLVTDLDPRSAARVLTSLRAQIRSREKDLAALGLPDLLRWRAVCPETCPPKLVIVVDEFAAMAAELPEFLTGLVDVAQRGRSLGIHLILATQRPAGVVSPAIKANITGRICLRVADDMDSTDVIDAPIAASISRVTPGRAYLRSAKNQRVAFQTGRVAGPWTDPDAEAVMVRLRNPDGTMHPEADCAVRAPDDLTDLGVLVAHCLSAAADLPPVPRPWLPPLPPLLDRATAAHLTGGEDARGALGMLDIPHAGRQELLSLPDGSALFLGPAGSGRSSALRTLAQAHLHRNPLTQLIVLDCTGGLRDLASWPACTTYLTGSEPALLARVTDRLTEELIGRSGAEHSPTPVLVIVDNWEATAAVMDPVDFGACTTKLAELAARGPTSAILVAAGASSRLQHTRAAVGFASRWDFDDPGASSRKHRVDGAPLPDEAAVPGRGSTPGGAQFQLMAPTNDIPGTGSLPATAVITVRSLPTSVSRSALPSPTQHALYWGLGHDDGRPVAFNAAIDQGSMLIAGPRRSGISSALRTITQAALHASIPVLATGMGRLSPENQALTWPGNPLVWVDLRAGPAALEHAFAAHEGPLLVIVDDGHDLQDHPAGTVLTRFLTAAGPGQNLVMGVRSDRLARTFRGLIADVAAYRRGILLQPDGQDGASLDVQLPRRRG